MKIMHYIKRLEVLEDYHTQPYNHQNHRKTVLNFSEFDLSHEYFNPFL